jgi:hypothetical protein
LIQSWLFQIMMFGPIRSSATPADTVRERERKETNRATERETDRERERYLNHIYDAVSRR